MMTNGELLPQEGVNPNSAISWSDYLQTYEIAAALGEPLDAPRGSAVYLININATYRTDNHIATGVAGSVEEIDEVIIRMVADYCYEIMMGSDTYTFLIPCPMCGERKGSVLASSKYEWTRSFSDIYDLHIKPSSEQKELECGSTFMMECRAETTERDGSTTQCPARWKFDLLSPQGLSLYTIESIRQAIDDSYHEIIIDKVVLGHQ